MTSKTRRTYSARNRPITSCSECTRRKQKCDRSVPCQRCVDRGAESKCSYDQPSQTTVSPAKRRKLHSSSPRPGNGIRISPRRNEGLSEQIGYSHGGPNALSVLEQLLNDAEGQLHATEPIIPGLHTSKQVEFWKAIDNLPSAPVVQALVQSFFSEANWYFAVLDQCFFDALLVQWTACHLSKDRAGSLSLTLSHFPPLLFQVLALALQFLPAGHPCEGGLGVVQHKDRDAMSA
jgi:hypothetical protein